VKATVPTGRGPWALAVAPATDRVYVANRLSDQVTVIDGRTNRAMSR
jgi:DNA-binding beta-propeller fold protein YncE